MTLFLNQGVAVGDLREDIKLSCAWLLKLYDDKRIIIVNNEQIDCSDLIYSCETRENNFSDFHVKATICVWKRKLHDEYSKYYYLNSKEEKGEYIKDLPIIPSVIDALVNEDQKRKLSEE